MLPKKNEITSISEIFLDSFTTFGLGSRRDGRSQLAHDRNAIKRTAGWRLDDNPTTRAPSAPFSKDVAHQARIINPRWGPRDEASNKRAPTEPNRSSASTTSRPFPPRPLSLIRILRRLQRTSAAVLETLLESPPALRITAPLDEQVKLTSEFLRFWRDCDN